MINAYQLFDLVIADQTLKCQKWRSTLSTNCFTPHSPQKQRKRSFIHAPTLHYKLSQQYVILTQKKKKNNNN